MSSSKVRNFKPLHKQAVLEKIALVGGAVPITTRIFPEQPGNDRGHPHSAKKTEAAKNPRPNQTHSIEGARDSKILMEEAQRARRELAAANALEQFIASGVSALRKQQRDEELTLAKIAHNMRVDLFNSGHFEREDERDRLIARLRAKLEGRTI